MSVGVLSSFGEAAAETAPEIKDFDAYKASTNVLTAALVKSLGSEIQRLAKFPERHLKVATHCYYQRSLSATMEQRRLIRNEIDSIRANQASQNERLRELEGRLGIRSQQRRRLT
jgi:hypothetical protein